MKKWIDAATPASSSSSGGGSRRTNRSPEEIDRELARDNVRTAYIDRLRTWDADTGKKLKGAKSRIADAIHEEYAKAHPEDVYFSKRETEEATEFKRLQAKRAEKA